MVDKVAEQTEVKCYTIVVTGGAINLNLFLYPIRERWDDNKRCLYV